jgi:hypothetical protein
VAQAHTQQKPCQAAESNQLVIYYIAVCTITCVPQPAAVLGIICCQVSQRVLLIMHIMILLLRAVGTGTGQTQHYYVHHEMCVAAQQQFWKSFIAGCSDWCSSPCSHLGSGKGSFRAQRCAACICCWQRSCHWLLLSSAAYIGRAASGGTSTVSTTCPTACRAHITQTQAAVEQAFVLAFRLCSLSRCCRQPYYRTHEEFASASSS